MAHRQQDVLDNSAGIPLHCNVCPKKPDFSDVSHLLTHIASKGHLSNYYKLKIKAASDRGAQRVTEEYDRWYDDYNVQDLMGERMKQKEKRKGSNGGGGGVGGGGSGSNTISQSRRSIAAPSTSRYTPGFPAMAERRRRDLRESTLDPQLGPRIKVEPDSRSGSPLSVDPAALSRSFMPPMQSWPTTPYGNSPMTQETSIFDSLDSSPSSEWVGSDAPKRGRPRRRARNDSNDCSMSDEEADELEYDDGLNDNTKLKGVYWDGMGMFDSATQDMRRKRNQKKAYSVIKSLMATSEVVEATEMVFDADGELHRERLITGNPNEDDGGYMEGETSPEPDSPPKKKPVVKRPRAALTQKNVNTGRVLRRQRDSHHPGFSGRSSRGPYYDGPDDDDELTYGPPRKRRTGLSIHRDNSGPEITFDNPASMHTLTSAFRPPQSGGLRDQSMYTSGRSNFNTYTHQRLPSLSANSGFRPANSSALGSFGQLTGQSLFHNNQFNPNPFANMMTGTTALAAFQHHMGGLGLGQQGNPYGNDVGMFHSHAQNLVQPQNA